MPIRVLSWPLPGVCMADHECLSFLPWPLSQQYRPKLLPGTSGWCTRERQFTLAKIPIDRLPVLDGPK